MLSINLHRDLLAICFSIYVFATWTSRAGMELAGLLTLILAWIYIQRSSNWKLVRDICEIYPWKTLLGLIIITIVGLVVNSLTPKEMIAPLVSQVYIILLLTWAIILTTIKFSEKQFAFFLLVVGLVAAYAIFQSFTGIDLLRPGSNRAVNPLYLPNSRVHLWRSAGLFDSPVNYAYVAGMHASFALAYALLAKKRRIDELFSFAVFVYILLLTSVITTYTRGAWAGMAVSGVAMASIINPKLGLKLATAGGVVLAILVAASSALRERLISVFDFSFVSNSDRIFLWRMNWEMFKDHPFFGVGVFQNSVRAHEYAVKLGSPDAFLSHAHNNYLEMLSGTGAIGFGLYLLLIAYMMKLTIDLFNALPEKNTWWRMIALGAFGAQAHLHIGGLVDANFRSEIANNNLILIWAFVIAGHYLVRRQPKTASAS